MTNDMQQYQRVEPDIALMGHECTAPTASMGGGGPPFSGTAPGEGRGAKSGADQAAGNSRTRLPLVSPGPDFSFSAKYPGVF